LKGIMAAKKKEIKEVPPSAEIAGQPSHQRIEKIYLPQKSKQTQLLGGGDAKRGAAELAEKLRTEARVIESHRLESMYFGILSPSPFGEGQGEGA